VKYIVKFSRFGKIVLLIIKKKETESKFSWGISGLETNPIDGGTSMGKKRGGLDDNTHKCVRGQFRKARHGRLKRIQPPLKKKRASIEALYCSEWETLGWGKKTAGVAISNAQSENGSKHLERRSEDKKKMSDGGKKGKEGKKEEE